jgi:hypothetical protein
MVLVVLPPWWPFAGAPRPLTALSSVQRRELAARNRWRRRQLASNSRAGADGADRERIVARGGGRAREAAIVQVLGGQPNNPPGTVAPGRVVD